MGCRSLVNIRLNLLVSSFYCLHQWHLPRTANTINNILNAFYNHAFTLLAQVLYLQVIIMKSTGACTWCGFQSLSKMTTVSAACRLSPSPPALVLSKKMKYWDPSSLNFFSRAARSSDLVVPETPNMIIFKRRVCQVNFEKSAWTSSCSSDAEHTVVSKVKMSSILCLISDQLNCFRGVWKEHLAALIKQASQRDKTIQQPVHVIKLC